MFFSSPSLSGKTSADENKNFSTEQGEDKLAVILFSSAAFLFFLFIVFVSWIPIGLRTHSTPQNFAVLSQFPSIREVYQFHELRDITLNVLLYLPLGVFTALAVLSGRKRVGWFAWPLGTLVSFTMEAGQVVLGRYADPVDVMTNSLGYFLGFSLIGIVTQVFHFQPQMLFGVSARESEGRTAQVFGAIRFIYASIYMIVALLPFDIMIHASVILKKLQPGADGVPYIILDPFFHLSRWAEDGQKLFFEILGLLPIAILTTLKNRSQKNSHWISPVLVCVGLAFLAESAQVFIVDRTSDVVLLPLALIAGVLGFWIVRIGLPAQLDTENNGGQESEASQALRLRVALLGVIFSIFFIAIFSWVPFQFEYDFHVLLHKLRHESNWLPFRYHVAHRSLGGALDLVRDSGLYFPLGVFLQQAVEESGYHFSKTRAIAGITFFVMILAGLIEASQLMCRGRYADITDVFLAGVGGGTGALTSNLFFHYKKKFK